MGVHSKKYNKNHPHAKPSQRAGGYRIGLLQLLSYGKSR